MALLCLLFSQTTLANTTQNSNQVTIFTDNFSVAPAIKSYRAKENPNVTTIGKVGSLNIIAGTKTVGYVAYVQQTNNANYLIRDTILVRCKKDVPCVTQNYKATRLGTTNLYRFKVDDYNQWQQSIAELENNNDVLDVAPSYEHGLKYYYD